MINRSGFTSKRIILRSESMFAKDIINNENILKERINNKRIVVIGGAGTIGSSFIKAILPFRPKSLMVIDINENALTELTRDLRSSCEMPIPETYVTYAIDYSSTIFEKIFRNNAGFDIVANFSAHKHVRSEKDIYSVEALLRNNVINVKKLLDLMFEYPPEVYFCVSTDKAANPVSVMGASKRIMEDLIFSYSNYFPVKTARFANVAFSNGSLLDGYIHRIEKKQPISAPSDIKRYFVSEEESGQICMLSCVLGENREIFFPKLQENQVMSFTDIAKDLIEECGYIVKECVSENEARDKAKVLIDSERIYPVYFSKSNTSGEKKIEEFFTKNELVDMYRFLSLGVVIGIPYPNCEKLTELLNNLDELFSRKESTKEDVVGILSGYLPEFSHLETKINLDQKM